MKLAFSVILLCHSQQGQTHNPDTVKCWSANNKLTWRDFRGRVPPEMLKSNRMAVCPSQIIVESVSHNAVLQFKVNVIFLKNKAWTKDTASVKTLTHEQLHFDITELYARKIRKSISELKAKKVTDFTKYQFYVQQFVSENERMQAEYDTVTNHGGHENIQLEWQEKIGKELNALKMFATVAKDCE